MRHLHAATAAVIIGLAPLAARANIITESFSITIPTTTLPGNVGFIGFSSSAFPQFHPAFGTLNQISVTLSGSATWTHTPPPGGGPQSLTAQLAFGPTNIPIGSSQDFTTPGTIALSLQGTGSGPTLGALTGTGTTHEDLLFLTPDTGDTIATGTPPLAGTITYDFTPVTVAEPSSLALMAAGLVGIGLLHRRKARR